MSIVGRRMRASAIGSLAALLVLAACTPASSSAPPSAKPAAAPASASASGSQPAASASGQAPAPAGQPAANDWNAVVAAARAEGVVQCACPPRPDYAKLIKDSFERDNPGIRVEASPATLPDIWARVEKEQEAGQFLWDVYMFGPTIEMFALKNKGAFESFRDYMVGPDIGDESVWDGGWDAAFLDREKRYIFAFWRNVTSDITINRDQLPTAQVRSFDDLLNPDYRGKMVWQDPRGGGIGVSFLTGAYHYKGRDAVKQLLVDQQPTLVRGNVEMAEQVLRAGRVLSVGTLSEDTLVQYRQAGVPLNLETSHMEDMPSVNNSGQAPAVFKNPPHPNATKVFVNWLMSRPTQDLLQQELQNNSTRKDVTPSQAANKPRPGVQYYHTQTEEAMTQVTTAAQRYARELLP
jgi:ABC-type Fe3+ transport system substrate-binding protein